VLKSKDFFTHIQSGLASQPLGSIWDTCVEFDPYNQPCGKIKQNIHGEMLEFHILIAKDYGARSDKG
jgi:hypothetical protein